MTKGKIFLLAFTIVNCGPCPSGYTQAPNGGDCFKTINFHDYFSGNYLPASFDKAETDCSDSNSGGLLASIHSPEENDFVRSTCDISGATNNIGLRCKGKECRWDDGTPVIYTNFAGDGPGENDGESCYAVTGNQAEWYKKTCGNQERDCWVCKVKTKTIDCVDGEIEYRGGCVSVHIAPIDQKSAEESCPNGGHLVSVHGSSNDNNFYKNAALNAGVVGSVYIGGQFVKGVFEWMDGTHNNYGNWANGFPNIYYGDCVQMLLDSSFGVQGQWTNVDCSTKQAYICFRDGATFDPNPVYPKADMKCPSTQYYYLYNRGDVGNVYSPNYPLTIPSQHPCEYLLDASSGGRASIKFTSYDCQSGTSLSLYNDYDESTPFITFDTNSPVINQFYSSSTGFMKIVFKTNRTTAPVGTGWAAKYTGQEH